MQYRFTQTILHSPFTGANESLGTLVLHCSTHEELVDTLKNLNNLVKIELES